MICFTKKKLKFPQNVMCGKIDFVSNKLKKKKVLYVD